MLPTTSMLSPFGSFTNTADRVAPRHERGVLRDHRHAGGLELRQQLLDVSHGIAMPDAHV
jgi:hypothetical protein